MKITRPPPPVTPQKSLKELPPGAVFELISAPVRRVFMRLAYNHLGPEVPCVDLATGERLDYPGNAPAEVLDAELVIH